MRLSFNLNLANLIPSIRWTSVLLIGTYFLLASPQTKASWDKISINKTGKITEFSTNSSRKFQGMVVYLIREISPDKGKLIKNDSFLSVTTRQMAFVCKTNRHYLMATTYHYRSTQSDINLNDPQLGIDTIYDDDARNWYVNIFKVPSNLKSRLLSACRHGKPSQNDERAEIPLVHNISENSSEFLIAQTVRQAKNANIEGWTKEIPFKMDVPAHYQRELDRFHIKDGEGPVMPLEPTIDIEKGYTLRRNLADCRNNRLATADVIVYDNNGHVSSRQSFTEDKSIYGNIVPGSVGEIVFNMLCSLTAYD